MLSCDYSRPYLIITANGGRLSGEDQRCVAIYTYLYDEQQIPHFPYTYQQNKIKVIGPKEI